MIVMKAPNFILPYLNKEGNINFMDLATDLFSSLSLGQLDDDVHKVLWPLMSKMEFTYH